MALVAFIICLSFASAEQQADYDTSDDYDSDDDYKFYDDWEYYSADGTGNNKKNKAWGSVGQKLVYNFKPVKYADQVKDDTLQNERIISNVAASAKHNQPRVSPRNVTDFLTAWAQFLDHDIVLSPGGKTSWPIPVPKCDRIMDPYCSGNVTIGFSRSVRTGEGEFDIPNVVTAWIDGSQIYGSNKNVQKALREFSGGRLRASKYIQNSEGEWPILVAEVKKESKPYIKMANDAKTLSTQKLFACGDVRCNEQPLLLSLQILFFREHNRVAGILAEEYPYWSDETLFQRARAYVIATLQHITFNEYLFWLMGGRPFDIPYKGYNSSVNPNIKAFFSTVAFRYGHSEVNHLIRKVLSGKYGGFPKSYFTELRTEFFDNRITYADGIGPIFQGMYHNQQSSMDNQATDDIRNFLFAGPKQKPTADLIAIDLRRARDHGMLKYSDMREVYGLSRVETWDDFESLDIDDEVDKKELVRFLKFLYKTPKDCDAFICGLSEDWVETDITESHDDYSNLGPLFEAVLHDQFAAIRDGDRFWYEQEEILEKLKSLEGLDDVTERTLADVIRDNTDADVDDDVFVNFDFRSMSRQLAGVDSKTKVVPIMIINW